MTNEPSRAERNIAWIEESLRKKIKLTPKQKRVITQVYSSGACNIAITMPRKTGKTFLCSAIAALHTFGPEAIDNGLVCSVSCHGTFADRTFGEVVALAPLGPRANRIERRITNRENGAKYRTLTIGRSLHHLGVSRYLGLSPQILIWDEGALITASTQNVRDEIEVLLTSQRAVEKPMNIVISSEGRDPENALNYLTARADLVIFA